MLSAAGRQHRTPFSNCGEPLERSRPGGTDGLIQAVNRFDAENGTDVLAFAVPTMMGEVADISAITVGR